MLSRAGPAALCTQHRPATRAQGGFGCAKKVAFCCQHCGTCLTCQLFSSFLSVSCQRRNAQGCVVCVRRRGHVHAGALGQDRPIGPFPRNDEPGPCDSQNTSLSQTSCSPVALYDTMSADAGCRSWKWMRRSIEGNFHLPPDPLMFKSDNCAALCVHGESAA